MMLPLVLFSDDTSGNRSKKWHKFDSWSVLFAGLPRQDNAKIKNIHFICCSDVVSALDMAVPLSQELQDLEMHGVDAYDSLLKQHVLILAPLIMYLS